MLQENTPAPDFVLKDPENRSVHLKDFRGKKVVLYFYPKDNTPGCTKEACSFQENHKKITDKGAVVLGISPDSVKSHINFREKYGLSFHLLSDPDKEVIQQYGAYGEKKMYGKSYMGVIRSTFIIDEKGTIIKVFPKVNVSGHSEEVIECL